jgi:hypothetical protein
MLNDYIIIANRTFGQRPHRAPRRRKSTTHPRSFWSLTMVTETRHRHGTSRIFQDRSRMPASGPQRGTTDCGLLQFLPQQWRAYAVAVCAFNPIDPDFFGYQSTLPELLMTTPSFSSGLPYFVREHTLYRATHAGTSSRVPYMQPTIDDATRSSRSPRYDDFLSGAQPAHEIHKPEHAAKIQGKLWDARGLKNLFLKQNRSKMQ